MKLYKYYSNWDYFEEVIRNNTLYFSDVKEFNDPYEEDAVFRLKKSNDLFSLFAEDYAKIKSKSKICCFSRTPSNFLLWSYYANKHKGYCIQFDFKNVQIVNNSYYYTSIYDKHIAWGEVNYNCPIVELDEFPKHGLHNDLYLQFFYKKYDYWKHEEEIRALIMSDKSLIVKIPRSYIKGIILGCKCENDEKVNELVRNTNSNIPVKKAIQTYSEKTVRIDV